MIQLPIEYTKSKFFEYSGSPEQTSVGYRASCPMCMEGNSWGEKKRLYYFPDKRYLFCHNGCGSFSDYFWVKEITGKSFLDIKEEIETGYDVSDFLYESINLDTPDAILKGEDLPKNSINLGDKTQVDFYKNEFWVKKAISFLIKRKILKAEYKPKSFYLSLDDYIHKNRLIIPFYNDDKKIISYQSRALSVNQEKYAKFLSKLNADKEIFNLDKIDYDIDYLFIMEGSLDAMFLKNGVAISGVYLTDYQNMLINKTCPFLKKVWIFDNPKIDKTGKDTIVKMAMGSNDLFFTWSDQFSEYKDLNEFCVKTETYDIDPSEIIKRSYLGSKALIKL